MTDKSGEITRYYLRNLYNNSGNIARQDAFGVALYSYGNVMHISLSVGIFEIGILLLRKIKTR